MLIANIWVPVSHALYHFENGTSISTVSTFSVNYWDLWHLRSIVFCFAQKCAILSLFFFILNRVARYRRILSQYLFFCKLGVRVFFFPKLSWVFSPRFVFYHKHSCVWSVLWKETAWSVRFVIKFLPWLPSRPRDVTGRRYRSFVKPKVQ